MYCPEPEFGQVLGRFEHFSAFIRVFNFLECFRAERLKAFDHFSEFFSVLELI
jgi:aspartyl/asparaginyl-tRNA synthetase